MAPQERVGLHSYTCCHISARWAGCCVGQHGVGEPQVMGWPRACFVDVQVLGPAGDAEDGGDAGVQAAVTEATSCHSWLGKL